MISFLIFKEHNILDIQIRLSWQLIIEYKFVNMWNWPHREQNIDGKLIIYIAWKFEELS